MFTDRIQQHFKNCCKVLDTLINVLCTSVFHLDITVAQEEDTISSLHFREIWIQSQLVVHTLHHGWSALLQEPLQAAVIPWCHPTKNEDVVITFLMIDIPLLSLDQLFSWSHFPRRQFLVVRPR